MKNYELLDMVGDVDEEYVQAADSDGARPRFRWQPLAACAACAALVVGGYMMTGRGAKPAGREDLLHDHVEVEVEDGGNMETKWEDPAAKAPAGGANMAPAPEPTSAGTADHDLDVDPAYGEEDLTKDGVCYSVPTQEAPVQEAALWYDALLSAYRLEEGPEWYGGAWIVEDRLLAVAIVDGFRTPELEAEIQEAAGAGAVLRFSTVKYSMEFLNGLMEPAARALEGTQLRAGVGVDVMDNCLGVDLYSDGAAVPDSVLAALAHLDPDGDAIRVRVFTEALSNDDGQVKGSAPAPASAPVTEDERERPAAESAAPAAKDRPEG